MPINEETNENFGVYKTVCCRMERDRRRLLVFGLREASQAAYGVEILHSDLSNRGQEEVLMVQLDQELISSARRLFNDADLHYVQVLIFGYKEAIRLHNEQSPGHQIYRIENELRLRKYVLQCQGEIIRRDRYAAIVQALKAQARFQ